MYTCIEDKPKEQTVKCSKIALKKEKERKKERRTKGRTKKSGIQEIRFHRAYQASAVSSSRFSSIGRFPSIERMLSEYRENAFRVPNAYRASDYGEIVPYRGIT